MHDVKDEQALFRQACSQQDVAALIRLNSTSGDYDLRTAVQMKLADWVHAHPEAFERAILQGDAPLDVRREALRRLVNANARRAVAAVLSLLRDPDVEVRRVGAGAIAWAANGGGDVAPLVTQALVDPDEQIRLLGVTSLHFLSTSQPDQFRAQLIEALDDRAPEVRQVAVDYLAKLPDSDVPPLLDRAFGDTDLEVRCQACSVAGRMAGTDSLRCLAQALADPEASVRERAVQALADRGNRADPNVDTLLDFLLKHRDPRLRRGGVDVLVQGNGTWGMPLLARALFILDEGQDLSAAVNHLARSQYPDRVDVLLSLLGHPEPTARVAAARALRKFAGDVDDGAVRSVLSGLARALMDVREDVRVASAEALGAYGAAATDAVPALVDCLDDYAPVVRRQAIAALAEIGAPDAVPALVQSLQDPDPSVASRAVGGLGQLGDERAIPDLLAILEEEGHPLHASVLKALAGLPDKRTIEALLAYEGPCQEEAEAALRRMRASLYTELRRVDEAEARLVEETVRDFVQDLEEDVVQGADADITGRSEQAVFALADIGAPAVEALISKLPRSTYAHKALGAIGGERAYQALIAELRSDNWRRVAAAAEALGNLGDQRAVWLLEPLRQSPSAEVYRAATRALVKLQAALDTAAAADTLAVDRSAPYEQVKQVWVERTDGRPPSQSRPREVYIAWHRAFVEAMPTLPFDSDAKRGHAWAMLGTLIYYLLNPNKSTIDIPCPEAAYCYAQCLKYTPGRNDIASHLEQVKAADEIGPPDLDEGSGEPGPKEEDALIHQWVERLLTLVEESTAANTLDVGRAEARQIGEEIHARGGFSLMQQVAYRTRDVGRQRGQRYALGHVERWWNGIGRWRA